MHSKFRFNKKLLTCTIILLCLYGNSSFGQETTNKSGTTAAQFLKIGVGARAMGMGGAIVASVDDPYSLYWNPGALSKVRSVSLVGVYTDWFADIKHQFIGFVLPIDDFSSVGFQATILSMGSMLVTTVSDPHGTGEFFEASDLSIGLSYGIRLTSYFSVGLTGKYITQEIYNESASTFAVDIGSVLDIPYKSLKLGIRIANFGGKMQLDGRDLLHEYDLNPDNTLNVGVETKLKTEAWELPVIFQFGLSADIIGQGDVFIPSEKNRFILSIDGTHPMDSPEFAVIGAEYIFYDILALRGGYRINRDVEKLFYGVGINVPLSGVEFAIDYSLASFEELDYVHIFSASLAFN